VVHAVVVLIEPVAHQRVALSIAGMKPVKPLQLSMGAVDAALSQPGRVAAGVAFERHHHQRLKLPDCPSHPDQVLPDEARGADAVPIGEGGRLVVEAEPRRVIKLADVDQAVIWVPRWVEAVGSEADLGAATEQVALRQPGRDDSVQVRRRVGDDPQGTLPSACQPLFPGWCCSISSPIALRRR
jgi:hypothetical protein